MYVELTRCSCEVRWSFWFWFCMVWCITIGFAHRPRWPPVVWERVQIQTSLSSHCIFGLNKYWHQTRSNPSTSVPTHLNTSMTPSSNSQQPSLRTHTFFTPTFSRWSVSWASLFPSLVPILHTTVSAVEFVPIAKMPRYQIVEACCSPLMDGLDEFGQLLCWCLFLIEQNQRTDGISDCFTHKIECQFSAHIDGLVRQVAS